MNQPVGKSVRPVTQRASGEAKNATTSAMSDSVPSRPRGVREMQTFFTSSVRVAFSASVSVGPGPTALATA